MLLATKAIQNRVFFKCNPLNFSSFGGIRERAGKSVKPGGQLINLIPLKENSNNLKAAVVLDGIPHKVTKITQGKRGKGGGFVRLS
jgi:hypothetical protein